MASAVGAPTGGRLRGGCKVGSLGVGIQWWTTCPDSMARAQWKKEAGRGTLGVPMIPFLGVEHVPREPGFEGGWEIDKQVKAMTLLVEWGIVSRVGHFRL